MHSIGVLVEIAIALMATGLVSRLLFLMLANWHGGFAKPFTIHLWSFCLCGMLFVIWCTVGDTINWFAAHKVFLPECAWFIFDCLRATGQGHSEDDAFELDRADHGR